MTTHRTALLVLLGVSLYALGSASAPSGPPDAHVLSFVPAGPEANAHELRNGIRITFDRDMVSPADVGRPVAGPAIELTPTVQGESRWLDARTLAFFPKTPLTASTTYSVRLATKLPSAPDRKISPWPGTRFVFDRIRVMGVQFEGDSRYLPARPLVHVTLSQTSSSESVTKACGFFEAASDQTPVRIPAVAMPIESQAERSNTRFPLTSATALSPKTTYVFRCAAGLKPAVGDAGLLKDHEQKLATYGPAKIVHVEPSGNDVASDNVRVSITFSTPVEPGRVRRLVELVELPSATKKIDLSASYDRTVYTWSGNLTTGAEYEIRIAAGLTDVFGQRLPHGKVGAFRVGDASPKLRMERGIFVVERSLGRYSVWARNLSAFQLRCAEVPESRLAAVLTGPSNYDAWWDAGSEGEIDYKGLRLTPREKTIRVRGARNQWHDTSVELASVCGNRAKSGVYLLEASSDSDTASPDRRIRRSLAQVTDLGLVAKVGNASSLVWVVSLSTGKPVAEANIKIRDLKGKVRFEGKTNADGVLQGPGASLLVDTKPRATTEDDGEGEYYEDYRARRVIVTAQTSDDFAVLDTNWNNGVQIWNFAVNQDRGGGKLRVRGFLHSDRGLYRPGDTVHLKGLVRLLDGAGKMAVPNGKRRIHLVIKDPRNKVLVDEDLAVSDFGGFHKDLRVDAESPLGDYHVRAELEGQSFTDRFSVEEYRPRTFEVKVTTAKRHVLIGQALRFDVKAGYLYGGPLKGGKLSYSLRRRSHLPEFPGFEEYVFQDFAGQHDMGRYWARYEERSFSDLVDDGELALDAKGGARVVIQDNNGKQKHGIPQDYILQATVSDESGESVSAGQTVIGHKSNLYLGLHPSEFVQAVDMPFGIQVVGFDKEGNRRAATAELEIVRRNYDCGVHDRGGQWSCKQVVKGPAVKRTVEIPASGSAAVERVVLKDPGEYVVRLSSESKGERSVASDVIWVIGKGEAFWSGDEGDRMTVVASKAKYAPGDTARLVPQAQMTGALALTTLERDGVMSYAITKLESSGQALEVKVTPELAPNVFASVVLVRGRTGEGDRHRPRFKMGLVDLKVESSVQRLAVAVSTERPSYQPGEEIKATVRVTTASGKPVAAELALAAADEGVLQIVGFKTPDPMAAFYAPFGLGVETATTWNRILRKLDPNQDDEEEGGDGGGDEAGRIRSRFMATAFWAPALRTDADGRVEVKFKAPDNLTAFRLMAVAADNGSRFGSGDKRFTVAKPLQAIPALPRFLAPGDHAQAAVAVHNNTDGKLDVTVTAKITGLKAEGPTARKVKVPAHASRRVVFDVTAERDGEAKFVFKATAQQHKDAVLIRVPVRRASIPETLVVGEGSTLSAAEHALPALGEYIPGQGGLEISLDRTGMGRLDEGLAYLVGYPYGCLEQTTSKVVPMIALSELASTARLPGLDAGQARKFVDLGIAKILRHQHEGGGFGLWLGATPEPHYTATGLWGLSVAKAAGFKVDAEALQRGATYLRAQIATSRRGHGGELLGERGTDAFAAYVLATLGNADAGQLGRLFEDRASMPIYGRAFLLRALLTAGRKDLAKTLTDELLAQVPASGLIQEVKGELGWYWSSNIRTTALVLWALTTAAPQDSRIGGLAEVLLKSRVEGRWSSTQENVFGLLALAELAKARASAGQVTVKVHQGNRLIAERTVASQTVERISVPIAKLGSEPLTVTAQGGEIFYSARIRVDRPMSADSLDHGISVSRTYLDPDSGTPLEQIRLGQRVLVRVEVTSPVRRAHVAVVDRLPAGFEPVLTRFGNADNWRQQQVQGRSWRDWGTSWQNQELRDDRMQVFADTLKNGSSQHQYLVRAASTGKFVVPPVTADAMYEPSIYGRSAGSELEILP